MLNLRNTLLVTGMLVGTAVVLIGCAEQTATTPQQAEPVFSDWQAGLDEDVVVALSELPEADRQAALAQKVCPVTDKQLGSMDKPPKVIVDGQEVFLCCDGCEPEISSDPEKYLAKLETAK